MILLGEDHVDAVHTVDGAVWVLPQPLVLGASSAASASCRAGRSPRGKGRSSPFAPETADV